MMQSEIKCARCFNNETPPSDKKKQAEIKFIIRKKGRMPEYETALQVDKMVEHASYSELLSELQRPDWGIICIRQGRLEITDETAYTRLNEGMRITVVYSD
jgi:hypothetical protein